MKRRHLLKYGTYAACSYGLTACGALPRLSGKPDQDTKAVVAVEDSWEEPEKKTLALGYDPTIAVAPWLVAVEQGFFAQFGLEVKLYKQPTIEDVEKGLFESRFDAAITPFATPLIQQLKTPKIDWVALMQVHRHGGTFTLGQSTWRNKIRSGIDYANLDEFAQDYREYVRSLKTKSFGVDHPYSMAAYLYRYWWAAMGLHPERDLELVALPATQLPHKLKAGEIQGYCSLEPWAQMAIAERSGFIGYLSGDVWRGHPGSVVTASKGWLKDYPNTAKALMAATLLGCQYCQISDNAPTIAQLLSEPLDVSPNNIASLFNGQYFYGGEGDRPIERKDSPIWFDTGENRLTAPDQANYCWQSHGIWLLTQMVRWQHFGLREYPANAEELVAAAYPTKPYTEVIQTFKLTAPDQTSKSEAEFIDQRSFDPAQAIAYLNQFKIRT